MTVRPALLAVALVAGCGATTASPPPASVRTVAVLPPSNRTGDPLLIAGSSLLERYAFKTDRITVGDVLAIELRDRLGRHGFAVVAPDVVDAAIGGRPAGSPDAAAELARHGHLTDPVLFVAIDRWEPDGGTHPTFVIVALDAALVDPQTGAVLWHSHRRASPIATPGVVTLASAYEIAAEQAAEDLVGSWSAARPAP